MTRCKKENHPPHLTPESANDCDEGRVGWWGCSIAANEERVSGHFFHRDDEEAALCDYQRDPLRFFLEGLGLFL